MSSDDSMSSDENKTEFMNNTIEKIKKLDWGETEYITDEFINCSITKNIRYNTYIFKGKGSKNIAKHLIDKTGYYKSLIQILDKNESRRFLPIQSWEDFWEIYKDEPITDRHLFELILSHKPCKPYLDIEWVKKKKEKCNYAEFVDILTTDIIKIFMTKYNTEINKENIMITTSHTDTKTSFHIVIDKVLNNKQLMFETNIKGKENSAWDLCNELIKLNKEYETKIDASVYTTDREFRTIYSNKTNVFRPFIPYNTKIRINSKIKLSTNECLKYIITHCKTDTYEIIKAPGIILSTSIPSSPKNIIKKEIIYTNEEIKKIVKLIKPIHKNIELTGKLNNGALRFTYYDKKEPCYTGKLHNSNGFYVTIDNNNKLYMRCLSNHCKTNICYLE